MSGSNKNLSKHKVIVNVYGDDYEQLLGFSILNPDGKRIYDFPLTDIRDIYDPEYVDEMSEKLQKFISVMFSCWIIEQFPPGVIGRPDKLIDFIDSHAE